MRDDLKQCPLDGQFLGLHLTFFSALSICLISENGEKCSMRFTRIRFPRCPGVPRQRNAAYF